MTHENCCSISFPICHARQKTRKKKQRHTRYSFELDWNKNRDVWLHLSELQGTPKISAAFVFQTFWEVRRETCRPVDGNVLLRWRWTLPQSPWNRIGSFLVWCRWWPWWWGCTAVRSDGVRIHENSGWTQENNGEYFFEKFNHVMNMLDYVGPC